MTPADECEEPLLSSCVAADEAVGFDTPEDEPEDAGEVWGLGDDCDDCVCEVDWSVGELVLLVELDCGRISRSSRRRSQP